MEHAGIMLGRGVRRSLLPCATDAGGARAIAALCGRAIAQGFDINTPEDFAMAEAMVVALRAGE